MAYERHPDGRVSWTRNERLPRGDSQLARGAFQTKTGAKRPKRNYAKALGTKKPDEGSRRDLEQQLESLLAKRVKMEAGYQCEQCVYDGAPTVPPLDAGHIYPKGKFPGGKFLYRNLAAQCRRHNLLHIRRPEFMFLWVDAARGEGSLEKLHAEVLSMPRKMALEWLAAQIVESEAAIKEMGLLEVA